MSVLHDTRLPKIRRRTRAAAQERIRRQEAAAKRKLDMQAIVEFARGVEGSADVKLAAVEDALLSKQLLVSSESLPECRQTLWRWLKRDEANAKAGRRGATALGPAHRTGRPRTELHARVARAINNALRRGETADEALKRGIKAQERLSRADRTQYPEPTVWIVRRMRDDLGLAVLRAKAGGSRTAQLDGVVHATVPADHPHHLWGLDTGKFPFVLRGYDHHLDQPIVFAAEMVLNQDVFSSANVSGFLADPTERTVEIKHKKTGRVTKRVARSGAGPDDILGCFLAGALPELNVVGLRSMSGFLPARVRADSTVRAALAEICEKLRIDLPWMPGERPVNRGLVERLIKKAKAWSQNRKGAAKQFVLVEESEEKAKKARTRGAAKRQRVPLRADIAFEDLPDIAEARAMFAEVLEEMNEERAHRTRAMPAARYLRKHLRMDLVRDGRDALLTLPVADCLIQGDGITHTPDGKPTTYYPQALNLDGTDGRELPRGRAVLFRADPKARGIFAQVDGETLFFPTQQDWARRHAAKDVAKKQAALARAASDRVKDALGELQEEVLGADGVARAAAARRQKEAEAKEEKLRRRREAEARRKAQKAEKARTAQKAQAPTPKRSAPSRPQKSTTPSAGLSVPTADRPQAPRAVPSPVPPTAPVQPPAPVTPTPSSLRLRRGLATPDRPLRLVS